MTRENQVSRAPSALRGIESVLARWELGFRHEALGDRFEQARQHLKTDKVGRRRATEARRAVDDTANLVRMTACLLAVDQRGTAAVRSFLAKQRYGDSSKAARYLIVFVDFDQSPCWLLVDELDEVDLDDVISAQPSSGRTVEHIEISRTDGQPLSTRESRRIAKRVTDDLFFDRDPESEHIEIEEGPTLCVYVEGLE